MASLTQNLAELWLIVPGFDDLLLNGESNDADGYTYVIDAIDADATWDHPQPVDVAVQRWMTDGAVAATQGHDNRTPSIKVCISAATSSDLAWAEAALVKRSARPCTLKWTPPEGQPEAPISVFEVWTWHLEHSFDSSDEGHLQRYYTLTFTAKPWVRSNDLTVSPAPAVPGAPTTISIDACTSTTNWTGNPNTPTTSGGAVKVTSPYLGGFAAVTATLDRTAAVTGLGATPYLRIDSTATPGTVTSFAVNVDGHYLTKVAQIGTVSYWQFLAGTTGFTNLDIGAAVQTFGATLTLAVADVAATDTIGGIGSRKMLARSMDVGGSVKTSGSILLASPSATALGNCLVYTCADDGSGYTPPLRQFRTSGNTVTPDATCVSGNREALVTSGASTGTITYTIPGGLLPEAQYVVVARYIFGAAASINATVTAWVSGFASNVVTVKQSAGSIGAAPGWAILGTLALPTQAMPAESGLNTVVTISATATGSTSHSLDELFLIDITHGGFTLVNNAGPFAFTRLWLDAPDADPVRNRPAIYIGTQADRSDAALAPYFQVMSLGDHDLDPDGVMLFTVTDGVDNAAATGSFYHRWHTHAGD